MLEPQVTTQEDEDLAEAKMNLVTKVPLWVLQNLFYPRGVRQEQRVPLSTNLICDICKKATVLKERAAVAGKVYHTKCYRARLANGGSNRESWVDTSGVTPRIIPVTSYLNSGKDGEMIGNLGDAEYHLWVGSRLVDNAMAICRCCRKVTNSVLERQQHKIDENAFISGMPCWKVIGEACKMIANKNRCMVCKKENILVTRYGVHLCGWSCVNTWKFAQEVNYLDFRCAIYNIRSQALEVERAKLIHEKPQFD